MLRWDRDDGEPLRAADLIRARAHNFAALIIVALQCLNQFVLLTDYGRWTAYNTVSLVAIMLLIGMALLPRFTRSSVVLGGAWSVVVCGAVGISVLSGGDALSGGIHTTLLPLLIASPILVAIVSDWRLTLAHSAVVVAMVFAMQHYSGLLASAMDPAFVAQVVPGRGTTLEAALSKMASQRMSQALIALAIVTSCAIAFNTMLLRLFAKLETALETAQQAEATKSDFLAQMSHEIRTPLNGIVAMSDLLAGSELPATARKPAEIVANASQHLVTIIDEILDSARLEAGRLEVVSEEFDLRAAMESVLETHRARAVEKGLWLGLAWAGETPTRYVGDDNRIRQVIGNFVSNALKFTERGGVRVEVTATQASGAARILIRVQDTGVGIAPAEIGSVFERYRQSSSGRRQGSTGTGLGLAIAKDLAELMGGEVGAHSLLGQGTAFHLALELPVAPTKADRSGIGRAA